MQESMAITPFDLYNEETTRFYGLYAFVEEQHHAGERRCFSHREVSQEL
jgi:hypothetical protein